MGQNHRDYEAFWVFYQLEYGNEKPLCLSRWPCWKKKVWKDVNILIRPDVSCTDLYRSIQRICFMTSGSDAAVAVIAGCNILMLYISCSAEFHNITERTIS